jgi:cell division protein FtsA
MNNQNFEVYFDCGTSKIRASAFDKKDSKKAFYNESKFFSNSSDIEFEIQKIVSSLEEKTKEYLNDVNLMIDSTEMLSIGISISKKLDGSKLKKDDIQFLIQDAKQQVLRNHVNQSIIHIIINNYKIDDVDHNFLPDDTNCNQISLEILFICLPKLIVEYFKNQFFKSGISVNQVFCSSYAKSINYKDTLASIENISFIDMGFNKTSITCYSKNKIIFLNVLPIGGNHITKDISKVLKVNLYEAENLKLFFDKKDNFLNKQKFSIDLLQQVMFARVEEILELSVKSIKLNLDLATVDHYKMVLMGEGSKILDNKFKEKITFSNDIDLLEETTEGICKSALKLNRGANKQEVVTIPKKQINKGFFEKLFYFFK